MRLATSPTGHLPGAHTLGSFLVHPKDSDSILVGTGTNWGDGDGVYATRDGGATWSTNVLPVEPRTVYRLTGDRADSTGNTVLAASEKGIWRSADFGASGVRVHKDKEVTDVVQDPSHDVRWYAGEKDTGAAAAICPVLPAGYAIVGDGPVLGPKQ